jgi:hypothetical protein
VQRGFDAFVGFFGDLWEDVKSAWNDTYDDLVSFKDNVVETIGGIPEAVTDALSGLVDAVSAPFKKAWEKAKEWVDKIKNLPGTITGGIGNAIGGIFGRAFAKGGIVMGPTNALIGEAGAEAVIPLHRPLHQIDPSVRKMAELLRSSPQTSAGDPANTVGRVAPNQVNNFTIHDSTGSAEATARKVVNRLMVGL